MLVISGVFGVVLLLNSPWVATELLGGWFSGDLWGPCCVWPVFLWGVSLCWVFVSGRLLFSWGV